MLLQTPCIGSSHLSVKLSPPATCHCRDIKPKNMLLDQAGRLVLADFGGSKRLRITSSSSNNSSHGSSIVQSLLQRTTIAGTNAYMPGAMLAAVRDGARRSAPYDAILADHHALAMSLVHMLEGDGDRFEDIILGCADYAPCLVKHIQQLLVELTDGGLYVGKMTPLNREMYQPVLRLIRALVEHQSSQHLDIDVLLEYVDEKLT